MSLGSLTKGYGLAGPPARFSWAALLALLADLVETLKEVYPTDAIFVHVTFLPPWQLRPWSGTRIPARVPGGGSTRQRCHSGFPQRATPRLRCQ